MTCLSLKICLTAILQLNILVKKWLVISRIFLQMRAGFIFLVSWICAGVKWLVLP